MLVLVHASPFSFSDVVSNRGKMGISVSFCPQLRGKIGIFGVFVESISEQFLLVSIPIIF